MSLHLRMFWSSLETCYIMFDWCAKEINSFPTGGLVNILKLHENAVSLFTYPFLTKWDRGWRRRIKFSAFAPEPSPHKTNTVHLPQETWNLELQHVDINSKKKKRKRSLSKFLAQGAFSSEVWTSGLIQSPATPLCYDFPQKIHGTLWHFFF